MFAHGNEFLAAPLMQKHSEWCLWLCVIVRCKWRYRYNRMRASRHTGWGLSYKPWKVSVLYLWWTHQGLCWQSPCKTSQSLSCDTIQQKDMAGSKHVTCNNIHKECRTQQCITKLCTFKNVLMFCLLTRFPAYQTYLYKMLLSYGSHKDGAEGLAGLVWLNEYYPISGHVTAMSRIILKAYIYTIFWHYISTKIIYFTCSINRQNIVCDKWWCRNELVLSSPIVL